jgi:hypothetical protein
MKYVKFEKSLLLVSFVTVTKHLTKTRIYFGSCLQTVQSMVTWPHMFGENITAMGECSRGASHFMARKEKERNGGRRGRDKISQGPTLSNRLPPASPNS